MKLISNGTVDKFGDSPWNVAIYDVSDTKKPNQICGGTIISPHLIVSGEEKKREIKSFTAAFPAGFQFS